MSQPQYLNYYIARRAHQESTLNPKAAPFYPSFTAHSSLNPCATIFVPKIHWKLSGGNVNASQSAENAGAFEASQPAMEVEPAIEKIDTANTSEASDVAKSPETSAEQSGVHASKPSTEKSDVSNASESSPEKSGSLNVSHSFAETSDSSQSSPKADITNDSQLAAEETGIPNTSPSPTKKSDVVDVSKSPQEEPNIASTSQPRKEKKANTSVKYMRYPLVAVPLAFTKRSVSVSPQKVNVDSAQMPAQSSNGVPMQSSWAEEAQDSVKSPVEGSEKPVEEKSVGTDNLQEHTTGGDKDTEVEALHSSEEVGSSSTASPSNAPVDQSNKGKGVQGQETSDQQGSNAKKSAPKNPARQPKKEKVAKNVPAASEQPVQASSSKSAEQPIKEQSAEVQEPSGLSGNGMAPPMKPAEQPNTGKTVQTEGPGLPEQSASAEGSSSKQPDEVKVVGPQDTGNDAKESKKEVGGKSGQKKGKGHANKKVDVADTGNSTVQVNEEVDNKSGQDEGKGRATDDSSVPVKKEVDDKSDQNKGKGRATDDSPVPVKKEVDDKPDQKKGKGRATAKAATADTGGSAVQVKKVVDDKPDQKQGKSAAVKAFFAVAKKEDSSTQVKNGDSAGQAKKEDSASQVKNGASAGQAKKDDSSSEGKKGTDDKPGQKKGKGRGTTKGTSDESEASSAKKGVEDKSGQDKGKGRATTKVVGAEYDEAPAPVKNCAKSHGAKGKGAAKVVLVDSSIDTDASNTAFHFNTDTGLPSPAESTPTKAQGRQQRVRQIDSMSSDNTPTASSAGVQTPKKTSVTESFSIFGRQKKTKTKNKKENINPNKKSKNTSSEDSKVAEPSKDKKTEQKPLAEIDKAANVPLPETSKLAEGPLAAKGKWERIGTMLLQRPAGRTTIFVAFFILVLTVLIKGVSGGGQN